MACVIGHANRHAHQLGLPWPELPGRLRGRFPYRRGSPVHQRHFLRSLSRGPGAPLSFRLGEHQTFSGTRLLS